MMQRLGDAVSEGKHSGATAPSDNRWSRPLVALWTILGRVGARDDDTPEDRTLKAVMTLAHLLALLNALYFSTVYLGMGRSGVAVSLLVFGAALAVNLGAFAVHRSLSFVRHVAFVFIYLHIVAYHVLLGGYVGSSGYIHYAVIVVVGLHLYFQQRPNYWLIIYLATGAALYVAEPFLAANVTPLPDEFRSLAMFNDYVIILCIVYLSVREFSRQLREERATIRDAYDELADSYAQLESAQARLVQAEKMASLGRLSSGLAHEIRNPVNFVNNFAEANRVLVEELRESLAAAGETQSGELLELVDEIGENVDRIQHHGQRADVIVGNMIQHAADGTGERDDVDLRNLVTDGFNIALNSYRARHPGFDAAFETDYAETLGTVAVSTREIARVFMNIFDNAFIAMEGAGTAEPRVRVSVHDAELDGAPAVRVVIRDDGPGVPEDVREKIFEPFFTTRAGSAGTGLGISLAYDIVVGGHGGRFELEPSQGGACFAVTLPAA